MPASNKVGTQLLVSPHLRDRARALAIVRHESVAEVWRAALEGFGIVGLERKHAEDLARLHVALNVMKVDKDWALGDMLRRRMRLEDLYRGDDGDDGPMTDYPTDAAGKAA